MRYRFALIALLTALPAAAPAQVTLPANPGLCTDLAVSVRFADGRDHRRAVFEVRNFGPGAAPAGRGAVVLATALTASGAPDQLQRFDAGGLAAGEVRSFTVTRAGHDPFAAWGLLQFAGNGDCNPANNSAVQAAH